MGTMEIKKTHYDDVDPYHDFHAGTGAIQYR